MNLRRRVVTAATTLGLAAFSMPVVADDSGASIYIALCQACHGADGVGVDRLGVTLAGSDFVQQRSIEELIAFLKAGRMPDDSDSVIGGVMPGFAYLSGDELVTVAGYLKSTLQN